MSSNVTTPTSASTGQGSLGIINIILLVIAATGPVSVLLTNISLAIGFGNGIGVPAVYLMLGVIYLLFSFGFSAMGTRITQNDSYFRYITQGVGQHAGASAAFIGLICYSSLLLALYALVGQFTSDFVTIKTGLEIPWWIYAAIVLVIANILSIKNIEFNGKILGIMMIIELVVISLFYIFSAKDIYHSARSYSFPFDANTVFSTGLGASIVLLINCFFGFEAVAIYAKSTKNPHKTMNVALIFAILAIVAIFSFSAWMFINVIGADKVVAMVQNDPAGIWFELFATIMHPLAADFLSLILLTSLFSATFSFHNIVSRYLAMLSGNKLLPQKFGTLHIKEKTPSFANNFITLIMMACVILFGCIMQLDALRVAMVSASPTSLGIVFVQLMTNFAIIRYFRMTSNDVNIFARLIAPLLSSVLFIILIGVMISNLDSITGVQSLLNYLIPTFVSITALGGYIYSRKLEKTKKEYALSVKEAV